MSGTAAALLVDANGRVLLGRRAAERPTYAGCWDAPGGHLEPGETPEEAMVREVREELDVRALAWTLLATVPFEEQGRAVDCHVYGVTAWTGEPRNACDEHDTLRWFAPEELDGLTDLASPSYPDLARRAVLARSDGDPYGARTRVSAVKGPRPNH